MPATISLNPMLTTSALNSFLVSTSGWIQGDFQEDPASAMWLASMTINNSVSAPLWTGMPVTETGYVSGTTANGSNTVLPATAATNITGWTVNDHAYAGIITTGNTVPLFYAGQTISVMRTGSNARIVVPINAGAVAALSNVAVNTVVYWDFVNNALNNTGTGALPVKLLGIDQNSKVFTYTAGAANWTIGTAALIQI